VTASQELAVVLNFLESEQQSEPPIALHFVYHTGSLSSDEHSFSFSDPVDKGIRSTRFLQDLLVGCLGPVARPSIEPSRSSGLYLAFLEDARHTSMNLEMFFVG
jgi:hypothetical protein